MRKTKEEAAQTRELLINTALSVFSRQGYAATSLEDIANEAGVTRGAIYWHFGSKAELFFELLKEYSSRGSKVVQRAAAEGGSLVVILRKIFTQLLEAVENDPALRAAMELSLFQSERIPELASARQQLIENSRTLTQSVAEAMRQGMISGELRADLDPVELARAYLALQNGAISTWLVDPNSFSLKESAPAFVDIFLKGVLKE